MVEPILPSPESSAPAGSVPVRPVGPLNYLASVLCLAGDCLTQVLSYPGGRSARMRIGHASGKPEGTAEEAIGHMSFLDGLYERLANRMLEKLSHMKNVKAPLFVDNYTLMTLMATAERAKTGLPLSEPLGSSRDFRDFQDLMSVPAIFPSPDGTHVNTTVTLGRQAKKPLVIPVPFMVSAYGYGVSVSKEIKIALAKGATLGGTATNSGEGGYLGEERQNAQRYIVQYNRAGWWGKGRAQELVIRLRLMTLEMSSGFTWAR